MCGAIPEQTVVVGETAAVSACFEDPNGDVLSYTASSSDPGVATVSISGTMATVAGASPGTGMISITATDATELQGQQTFRVLVPNRAPVAVGEIDSRELRAGESAGVDVSAYFTEPDGQPLSYAGSVSDEAIVKLSMSGPVVTFEALGKGTAAVTATATDPGGLTATQSFVVTVPNRAPGAVGSIEPQIIEVDATATTDVTGYFTDPDGDDLTLAAASSAPAVATVSIHEGDLTVAATARGEATVTVMATDTEGLTATQTFVVTVPNRPPLATGSIKGRTIEVDETSMLDLSGHFSDPDGDDLVYSAMTSDGAVAGVHAGAGVLTVTAVAKGEATVTVTATDTEGLTATQAFGVSVPNRPPLAAGSIKGQTLEVDQTATVELSGHFSDPDGDDLVYTASGSDAAVVGTSVDAGAVTVTAVAKGEATVTITATDNEGLTASQMFAVTVPNRPPRAVGAIEARTLEMSESATVDLSGFFEDPDGDDLVHAVSSSDATLIAVSLDGTAMRLEALAKGSAAITVTATDTEGLTATQTFAVSVANRPPHPVGSIAAQTVEVDLTARIDLSSHFEDPDGDALVYTATATPEGSSINLSVTGASLEVTALGKGEVGVTVTATDTEGMTATQEFLVTVPNRTPEAVGSVPDMRVREGGIRRADPSPLFTDPDGDELALNASSSDPQVARAWVASNGVMVRGMKDGTATVTISAEDPEGLTATVQFAVRVDGSGGGNQPPFATGSLAAQTLKKGESRTLDISSRFSDPDGDNLRFSAESSSTGTVTATASGGQVELRAVASGAATVKIIARDPDGLSASLNFAVTVSATGGPNRPPVPTGTILEQDMAEGDKRMLNASSYFADPDDDDLSFAAESSDTEVVKAATSGDEIELEVVSQGTATITVTAEDPEGLQTEQAFGVTIGEAASENRAPATVGTVSAQNLQENGSTTLDASTYFVDPDADALAYSAESSDDAVVTATVSGSEITLQATGAGTATVTLTAEDPSGLEAALDFDVTVVEEPTNRAPVAGAIDAQSLKQDATRTLDASAHFSDPDEDELSYAAESSDAEVVTATVSGSEIELRGVATGSATVSVTAADPDGLTATASFQVTVTPAGGSGKPPRNTRTPSSQTFLVDAEWEISSSWYFWDPDHDYSDLTTTVESSNSTVMTAEKLEGATILLTGKSEGDATITITVTDPDGLSASTSVVHTVGNNAPRIYNTYAVGDIARTPGEEHIFFLHAYALFQDAALFEDNDVGDHMTFTMSSSDPTVATAEVEHNIIYRNALVKAVALGEATITATATDEGGLSTDYSFVLTVNNNKPPRLKKEIPDPYEVALPDSIVLPLSEHIEDPEGDSLTYVIRGYGPFTGYLTGDTLVITRANADILVYATDPEGRTTFFEFEAEVSANVQGMTSGSDSSDVPVHVKEKESVPFPVGRPSASGRRTNGEKPPPGRAAAGLRTEPANGF